MARNSKASRRKKPVPPGASPATTYDYEELSVELLRALRGRRSRPGFSQYLGFKSNVAQRWESKISWPNATTFFKLCHRVGKRPERSIERFLRRRSGNLGELRLATPRGVASLLAELRGTTPILTVAKQSHFNRYSVSRWLKGEATPNLPQLLALVDTCSRRLPDFAACFAYPERLPTILPAWKRLEAARELAHEQPMAHAVMRALEIESPAQRSRTQVSFLANKLGIEPTEVIAGLQALEMTGQAQRRGARVFPRSEAVIDTGEDFERARAIKLQWARLAVDRMAAGSPGHFGYSLFSASRETVLELQQIHRAYVRQMTAAIASSKRNECVGIYCSQLLDLSSGEDNALKGPAPEANFGQLK